MHNGGWYFQSDTPGEIDSQGIMDGLLNLYASKGVDFVMYDEYGIRADADIVVAAGAPYTYQTSNPTTASKITNGLFYHRASPNAAKVKYAVNIVADWFSTPKVGVLWGWEVEHATALRALFNDPNYQRYKGKPIVGLFNAGFVAGDSSTFLTHWNATIKAILGDVWLILTDKNTGTTNLTNFAAHAKTTYGNASGAPGGAVAGRNAYSLYQGEDLAIATGNDARALRAACASMTGSDVRPRGGNPAFCDYPAHDDVLATLRALMPLDPLKRNVSEIMIIAAADEFDEGELIDPTRDNGTEMLDVIAIWKGLLNLSASGRDGFGNFGVAGTYTYSCSFSTKYWTKTGSWTTGTAIDLAYQNEEQRSSTSGDTLIFSRKFTGLEIRGKRGTAQGRFTISIDGGAATTIDTGGIDTDDVLFYTSPTLTNAVHSVTITVLGDHVLGSGNQVALQRSRVTYVPG